MRVVDLFSGAGGESTGLRAAGASIVAAVNHWPVAVASHRAAHPEAAHFCEDAAILDPTTLPAHDLLWASPSCTGHTRARGVDRPHHDAARATAWCVLRVAEAQRPRAIVVENVPEMLAWACYRGWRLALSDLGYRISEQVLDAADVGVPQNRARLYVVALRARRPLVLEPGRAEHVAARTVLDLDAGPWSDVATKCAATRARIDAGRLALGADFLAPYFGSGSGLTGRSLDRPIGTLTTKDRYALVRGDRMRMLSLREQLRLAGFPADYPLAGGRADGVMQVGNANAPPMARHIVAQVMGAA